MEKLNRNRPENSPTAIITPIFFAMRLYKLRFTGVYPVR